MGGWVDGWRSGGVEEWRSGGVDGWMGGWVSDRLIYSFHPSSLIPHPFFFIPHPSSLILSSSSLSFASERQQVVDAIDPLESTIPLASRLLAAQKPTILAARFGSRLRHLPKLNKRSRRCDRLA
jgi:hypothetical protein